MFEVGPSELLVIGVLALLVLGPERLPRAARMAGLWVRRLRAHWYSVRADLERELAEEDLRRSLGEPLAELRNALADEAEAMRRRFDAPVVVVAPPSPPLATEATPLPPPEPPAATDPPP
jgi:sec-independent protein translocase protein TatB